MLWLILNIIDDIEQKHNERQKMFKKIIPVCLLSSILAAPLTTIAEDIPIVGTVSSKCVIYTETSGVYGNPTPNVLSTAAADGGVQPIVRFDVVQSGYYKAVITTPNLFTSAPLLTDVINWTGSVEVSKVTDAAMSAYTTNKRIYNETTEFNLTVPGSVWFKTNSRAEYGYNKAFPAGTYRSIVTASCIAL